MAYKDEILPWMVLLNYIITLIFAIFAIYFTVNLIKYSFSAKLAASYSPTMNFYFYFALFSGIITFLNTTYMIIFWRPGTVTYNAFIIFFTGTFATRLQAGIPVIEFFLCIDRILTVLFPMKYNFAQKRFTAIFAACMYLILTIIFFIVTDSIGSLPEKAETTCQSVGCLKPASASGYTSAQKCFIAAGNCFAAIFLGYLMKTRITTTSQTAKRLNRVVIHMLIIAFFFDFLPNLTTIVGPWLNFKLSDFTGPHGNTVTTINVSLSCYLYWKMFKRILLKKFDQSSSMKNQQQQPTGWTK